MLKKITRECGLRHVLSKSMHDDKEHAFFTLRKGYIWKNPTTNRHTYFITCRAIDDHIHVHIHLEGYSQTNRIVENANGFTVEGEICLWDIRDKVKTNIWRLHAKANKLVVTYK